MHRLRGYYLAASLFLLCGSFTNFLLAIGLGSLVIFVLMNLIGWAGEKTGVPYPVLARASFGVWGANLAAVVRAIVAIFWYGAQTAAASGALVALLVRHESMLQFHQGTHWFGHSGLEVICYVTMWALQLLIIQKGMETVRRFQDWAGPAVWVAMLVLAVGLTIKAGGFSMEHGIPMDVLLDKTKDAGVNGQPGSFWALTAVGATWITYFAALYLNFCDFSRYAKDRAAVTRGNLWGLPVDLIAFSLVAGVTTISAYHVYGEVLLHPEQISAKFDSWVLAAIAALTFAVATLGINVVANFVSSAFDISNVFPRQISFKRGGYIAALIALVLGLYVAALALAPSVRRWHEQRALRRRVRGSADARELHAALLTGSAARTLGQWFGRELPHRQELRNHLERLRYARYAEPQDEFPRLRTALLAALDSAH